MFQSSPTSKGGRYRWWSGANTTRRGFQSSPTSKGGRYDKRRDNRRMSKVSILAHLERWALLLVDRPSRAKPLVSILAHLER